MDRFAIESNWTLVYDQITTAQGVADNPLTYRPINPITLPFSLQFPFIRVTANYEAAKSRWRLGAWIDFLVDEPNPEIETQRILAPVNKPIIMVKPAFLDSYKLRAVIPYYFEEISLRIDGFTGTIADPSAPFVLGL